MSKQASTHSVTVKIVEFIEPTDRVARYEKPLAQFLESEGLGRLKGAENQVNEQYKIVSAELELELRDVGPALVQVQQEVERLGAPAGSELRFLRNGTMVNRRIGKLETAELYLNLSGLTQEAFEELDFHSFSNTLRKALKTASAGELRGIWSGPEETSLLMCGEDSARMKDVVAELKTSEPLLNKSRMVLRSKDPKAKPVEVRL